MAKIAPESLTERSRLHRKANEVLDQNLSPGETVQVIITGANSQAIIGTDRRVFVYKKGIFAGASFGAEITSWDYRGVVGVQIHTGMMTGAVIVQAPGQSGVRTSSWKAGEGDPYKAPNAIPIVRPWDQAQVGVARLRQLIEEAHQSTEGSEGRSAARPSTIADELKKLADLRDAGALSEEEFLSLKAKVLHEG
ncbi:SHOCT domain-containing protein [Actinomadura coerulea]|uniref:SHOCT domain-containing protein n=1 Tax=Actinomadura coerulea TaxID=46159 RepID=UPI00343C947F